MSSNTVAIVTMNLVLDIDLEVEALVSMTDIELLIKSLIKEQIIMQQYCTLKSIFDLKSFISIFFLALLSPLRSFDFQIDFSSHTRCSLTV